MAEGGYVLGADYPEDYTGTCAYRDEIPGRDVECVDAGGNEAGFGVSHFFYPFDRVSDVSSATDQTPLLSSALLRRAGVATPLDAEVRDRKRSLTHLGFTISDQSSLPTAALEAGAYVGLRYAVPGRQSGTGLAASDGFRRRQRRVGLIRTTVWSICGTGRRKIWRRAGDICWWLPTTSPTGRMGRSFR